MRLFHRKKDIEFDDDAKLVGMAPLAPDTQEEKGPNNERVSVASSSSSSTPSANKTINLKGSCSRASNIPQINKSSNGGLSTWSKKVGRTWENLLRSESSEKLNNCSTLITSTTNRKKTLHFYPSPLSGDPPEGNPSEECVPGQNEANPVPKPRRRSSSISSASSALPTQESPAGDCESLASFKRQITRTPSSVSNLTTTTKTAPRKIGRVESLRNLLSKRTYRSRSKSTGASKKVDKGTDTGDLDGDDIDLYGDEDYDEVFEHRGNRRVSLFGGFSSNTIASAPKSNGGIKSLLPKSTSCENLSFSANNPITYYQHVSTSTSTAEDSKDGQICTSTFNSPSSLSSYIPSNYNSIGKKSSFPYAYIIRSKLTSLPEEPPANRPSSPPSSSASESPIPLIPSGHNSTRMTIKGFYHSMGNLLTTSGGMDEEDEEEEELENEKDEEFEALKQEKSIIEVRPPEEEEEENQIESRKKHRDPLAQIRIDLLHKNPSEIDEEGSSTSHSPQNTLNPSPNLWGRRSFSIGDMMLGHSSTSSLKDEHGILLREESGYDSDSTRNGHESPRNSFKRSEGENESEASSSENERESSNSANEQNEESSLGSNGSGSFDFNQTSSVWNTSSSPQEEQFFKESGPNSNGTNTIIRKTKNGNTCIDLRDENEYNPNICHSEMSPECVGSEGPKPKSRSICTNLHPTPKSNNNIEDLTEDESTVRNNNKNKKKEKEEPVKSSAPSLKLRNKVRDRDREWNSTRSARAKSLCLSIFTVTFEKGPDKKSLGFSVVGGKDSPRGDMGIYIRRILPYGQAAESDLEEGDEVLSINGNPLAGVTHSQALNIFKDIKSGTILLNLARREVLRPKFSRGHFDKSISCENLDKSAI